MAMGFRSWWRPPRRAADRPEGRTVTFLELFYDLVYVVSVAELAHALAAHPDWRGVGTFAFLFAILWWSWLNGTTYHDAHGNNDIRTRVFTFLQMGAVAAMAVFAHNALGEGSVGFALAYGVFQLILAYMWWRTGVHDPDHRVLSRPYALVFVAAALLFFGSLLAPPPLRFWLWGVGVVITLILPVIQFAMRDERARAEIDRVLAFSPALVERFGLFTILVLAEVIVGIVQGLTGHGMTATAGWTAALALPIAFGLWWLYFDFASHRPPRATRAAVSVWAYLHLFLTMAITATGAALLLVVESAGHALEPNVRWLLVGGVATFLVALAPLLQVIRIPPELRGPYRTGSSIVLVVAAAIAAMGFTALPGIPLLALLVALLLTPVAVGVVVWVRDLGARDLAAH